MSIRDLLRDRLGRDPAGIVLSYLRLPLPFLCELRRGNRVLFVHTKRRQFRTDFTGIFSRGFLTDVTMLQRNKNYFTLRDPSRTLIYTVAVIAASCGVMGRCWNVWLNEDDFDLVRGALCNRAGISGCSCMNYHQEDLQ